MAEPQLSSVYIARSISNAAIGYSNAQYIAQEVFPVITVPNRKGKYFTFDRGEWVQDAASSNRMPGTDAPRGGYSVSNEEFNCEEWAFAHAIPDEIVEQADEAIQPFERGIRFCMERVMLRRERVTAAVAFASAVWGTTKSVSSAWSDLANCDVVNDIREGQATVLKDTGREPNTLLVGRQVWDQLVINPDLKDQVKYVREATQGALQAAVASWLGVDRVIVGAASYNAAVDGATVSREFIWGKNALLYYRPSTPAIDEPAAGYLFQLKDISTRSWREESPKQTVVEAALCGDPVMTASKAGYYFASVVA